MENSLKFGSLSMRISTLHGILYLLESAILTNCEETLNALNPLTIDYVHRFFEAQDNNR